MHNYTKRTIAFIILVSHMLTSCWNGPAPKNEITVKKQKVHKQQPDNSGTPTDIHPNTSMLISASIVHKEELTDDQISYPEEPIVATQQVQSFSVHASSSSTVDNKELTTSYTKDFSASTSSYNLTSNNSTTNAANKQSINKPTKIDHSTVADPSKFHKLYLQQNDAIKARRRAENFTNVGNETTSISHIFTTKGGHQVRFTNRDCTEAMVDENIPKPLSRRLRLPIKKQNPNLKFEDLVNQSTAWQQHHIHIYFPEKDPKGKGCVYIGNQNIGLLGGGIKCPKCHCESLGPMWCGISKEYQFYCYTCSYFFNRSNIQDFMSKSEEQAKTDIPRDNSSQEASSTTPQPPVYSTANNSSTSFVPNLENFSNYSWLVCSASSAFPIVHLGSERSEGIATSPLRTTNLSHPLQISAISYSRFPVPNPTASGIRFESPSPLQQVMRSRPMQDLAGAVVDLGFTIFSYSKQVEGYHEARAEAAIARLDAKVEESMRRLKESSYQAAIESAQQEEEERKEEERKTLEKEKLEGERLQRLIEKRLAFEKAGGIIKNGKDFIANYRISNVEDIKEFFEYAKESLTDTTNKSLSEEQQKDICSILKDINNETKEIIETLGNITYGIKNSGILQELQYKPEHLEIATKLLEDLKNYKEQLRKLLAEKGEDLADYEEETDVDTAEEKENYRELEEEINDPSDAVELVANSHRDMQALLDETEGSDSKRRELEPKAMQVATHAAEIVEVFKSRYKATEKLYFDSDTSDYINRTILEGVQKMHFLRASIDTLKKSLHCFCDQFKISWPQVPSAPIITKETLKVAFNTLLDLLVPGSELVKAVLGSRPLPQTPKEWASLAMEAGFDFIPCGKILKLVAGPAKPFLRKKIKGFIVRLLKKRGKKVCPKFLKALNKKISIQKQARHIAATKMEGKGFMSSLENAQSVLDAVHAGKAEFLGVSKGGHQVFRFHGVTGTNVNLREKIIGEPTNVFKIKGTTSPTIVPTKPNFKPIS